MKESFYNIFIDLEGKNETVIFNSLYGSMVLFNSEEKPMIKKYLQNPNFYRNEYIEILIKQKMIIDNKVDELDLVAVRKRRGVKDNNRLDLILMPTLNCNFRCTYCFEEHIPSKMSEDMVEGVKKWLKEEIPKYKFLMIHWYGGEPLLADKTVYELSTFISEQAKINNVLFTIHVTTNGYLINEKIARNFLAIGIADYQITLDGPPDVHNEFRVLKGGRSTFKRVFNKIIMLANIDRKIKITLRINFNHNNINRIPELLNMFPEEIREQIRVVYEPIFGDCSISATSNICSSDISNNLSQYYELANRLGYDVALAMGSINTGKLVYCYAERENQYIINFNGDCFKCSVSNFNPHERVGYIDKNGNLTMEADNYAKWISVDGFRNACNTCKYLPLCMGGCKRVREENSQSCSLISTNASYLLKQLALGYFDKLLQKEVDTL